MLLLIRHAAVTVRPDRPSAQWHLSPKGRAAAEVLAGDDRFASLSIVYASSEPKAIATAQRIAARHALRLEIDNDLHEVERPWSDEDYRDLVRRYLTGEALEDWEPRDDALARVRRCVDDIAARHANAAIVSHGLALTLYLTQLLALDSAAAFEFWSNIAFPDLAVVDPAARQLISAFGR